MTYKPPSRSQKTSEPKKLIHRGRYLDKVLRKHDIREGGGYQWVHLWHMKASAQNRGMSHMLPNSSKVPSCACPCGFDVSSWKVSSDLRELAANLEPSAMASRVGWVFLASFGGMSPATLLRASDLTWNLLREEIDDCILERKESTAPLHAADVVKLLQPAAKMVREVPMERSCELALIWLELSVFCSVEKDV